MIFDYRKLSGKIIEKYNTRTNFAKAMGFSMRTFSLKMNNHIDWKQREIVRAIELLGISKEDIGEYFFTLDVQIN